MASLKSERKWPLHLPLALIGGLLLIGLISLALRLEKVDKEVDLGPTQEAKRNPFLASQRLLQHYDIPFVAQNGFSGLQHLRMQEQTIGANDTLILINTYQNLRSDQVHTLWEWVEQGGRLIISVENPFIGSAENIDDPLLNRMGLTLYPNYDSQKFEEDDETVEEDNTHSENTEKASKNTEDYADSNAKPIALDDHAFDACVWLQTTVSAQLQSNEPSIDIGVSGDTYLISDYDNLHVLAGDDTAIYLAKQNLGAGEIFVSTSAQAWQNSNIDCNDNAYFFWRLVQNSPKVWMAINQQTPSFWRHLWHLSPAGCIALLIALVFWLWNRANRFGPVLHQNSFARRRFLEHIQAAAQFRLRHEGSEAMITTLRIDIQQRAEQRHPGFHQLSAPDQIAVLHSLCGLDESEIQLAMQPPATRSRPQFVELTQRLQHLRNRL